LTRSNNVAVVPPILTILGYSYGIVKGVPLIAGCGAPEIAANCGEVFVVRGANGALDATLQLQDSDPDVWGADDGDALYLHRLTVARRCAGSGLGGRLLAWALGEAGARGRALLRLDCVASNDFLRRYYAAAGFSERGEARLRELLLTRFERAVPPRS
jgi:GNAT superfamily N-acetyltransferase